MALNMPLVNIHIDHLHTRKVTEIIKHHHISNLKNKLNVVVISVVLQTLFLMTAPFSTAECCAHTPQLLYSQDLHIGSQTVPIRQHHTEVLGDVPQL
jgi:hypothetical protein